MRKEPIITEFLTSGKKETILVVTEKWVNWERDFVNMMNLKRK